MLNTSNSILIQNTKYYLEFYLLIENDLDNTQQNESSPLNK